MAEGDCHRHFTHRRHLMPERPTSPAEQRPSTLRKEGKREDRTIVERSSTLRKERKRENKTVRDTTEKGERRGQLTAVERQGQ